MVVDKKVLKRSGTLVEFERDILEQSLRRAGASVEMARSIAAETEGHIKDGDSTAQIYKNAFEMLYSKARKVAMRYSLKKALFSFGPTGFPFEKFVAEIFRRKGYTATNNVHLRGSCISHEIDVLATGPERIAMEVKFHNDMRIRSDVKAVLYIKARFDDLTGRTHGRSFFKKGVVDKCILVTNTKFTKNAIAYANCAGVRLLGWGYPYSENLQTYIEDVNAHPVTCLPSLSTSAMRELFSMDIVTCRGLLENERVLKKLPNADALIAEAEMLCTSVRRE